MGNRTFQKVWHCFDATFIALEISSVHKQGNEDDKTHQAKGQEKNLGNKSCVVLSAGSFCLFKLEVGFFVQTTFVLFCLSL